MLLRAPGGLSTPAFRVLVRLARQSERNTIRLASQSGRSFESGWVGKASGKNRDGLARQSGQDFWNGLGMQSGSVFGTVALRVGARTYGCTRARRQCRRVNDCAHVGNASAARFARCASRAAPVVGDAMATHAPRAIVQRVIAQGEKRTRGRTEKKKSCEK